MGVPSLAASNSKLSVLQTRVLELSYKNKLAHLSSTLTAVDILLDIYEKKDRHDLVILSQGQAGLALYAVLEQLFGYDAQALLETHGPQPHRDTEHQIWASTGSLGMGLTVALGMAMVDKTRRIHCLISDGECAEGSVWESLRLAREFAPNLDVYVNDNGMSALGPRLLHDRLWLKARVKAFLPSASVIETHVELPFVSDTAMHYHVMTKEDADAIGIQ